jgi:hypothetical protein
MFVSTCNKEKSYTFHPALVCVFHHKNWHSAETQYEENGREVGRNLSRRLLRPPWPLLSASSVALFLDDFHGIDPSSIDLHRTKGTRLASWSPHVSLLPAYKSSRHIVDPHIARFTKIISKPHLMNRIRRNRVDREIPLHIGWNRVGMNRPTHHWHCYIRGHVSPAATHAYTHAPPKASRDSPSPSPPPSKATPKGSLLPILNKLNMDRSE